MIYPNCQVGAMNFTLAAPGAGSRVYYCSFAVPIPHEYVVTAECSANSAVFAPLFVNHYFIVIEL